MKLREYQQLAFETDQNSAHFKTEDAEPTRSVLIPLLGMAGEVATLLTQYKKLLRDGPQHVRFKSQVAEELGDILWYVADVATKFDLNLEEIAQTNIEKVRGRFTTTGEYRLLDEQFPEDEQLPREFEYTFNYVEESGLTKIVLVDGNGRRIGNALTDNARKDDGYRFHDVLHFANVAVLGWSPVARKLMGRKRRSDRTYDEVEDGGRAAVIEEGIVASMYEYAQRHKFLEGVQTIDWELLRSIQRIVASADLEVKNRTAGEWERAILTGFAVWRAVCANDGGTIRGDLRARTLTFISAAGQN